MARMADSQPLDRTTVEHLAPRVGPIRRQLLGLTTTYTTPAFNGSEGRSGRFYPNADDVPLQGFIRELLGEDAGKHVARGVGPGELRAYD